MEGGWERKTVFLHVSPTSVHNLRHFLRNVSQLYYCCLTWAWWLYCRTSTCSPSPSGLGPCSSSPNPYCQIKSNGKQTERQTDRQTNRQTDRQTDRQKDRQTDKQTDRQTETNRDRLWETVRGRLKNRDISDNDKFFMYLEKSAGYANLLLQFKAITEDTIFIIYTELTLTDRFSKRVGGSPPSLYPTCNCSKYKYNMLSWIY